MKPKFIAAIYFEGRILLFTENGDCYEYNPHLRRWTVEAFAPWPEV